MKVEVEMLVEVHQGCHELLVSTYPDTSEIYNIKIIPSIPPKNDDVIYEQPLIRGEREFPFPVIPRNTSLKFPVPSLPVAICKFPFPSRKMGM